jgi:cytochrome c oxidase subunit 3
VPNICVEAGTRELGYIEKARLIWKDVMPGTKVKDTELIIDDIGGGGGGGKPPAGGRGGGDGDKGGRPWKPPQRRYSTAIMLGMISILMFFLGLCVAFLVLRHVTEHWASLRLPKILWLNTAILLSSSVTLEKARRRLSSLDFGGFRKLWRVTIILGALFLAGQIVAWLQLVLAGTYLASTQGASFFYIFTAAHAVHLAGGLAALVYVAVRNFEKGRISVKTAVEITSYYWHFMGGLWVVLLTLLYVGR